VRPLALCAAGRSTSCLKAGGHKFLERPKRIFYKIKEQFLKKLKKHTSFENSHMENLCDKIKFTPRKISLYFC
jgi:hypothetical protein